MVDEKCEECGKILKPKDKDHEPFCKECDEKLDRMFDSIEDNMIIFRELLDTEIEILNKFEKEDIIDLFKKVHDKLSKEKGGLKRESIIVLNKLKGAFNLNESDLGIEKLPDIKESREEKLLKNEQCPGCEEKIKKEFNLCPYCGYKLNKDFEFKY